MVEIEKALFSFCPLSGIQFTIETVLADANHLNKNKINWLSRWNRTRKPFLPNWRIFYFNQIHYANSSLIFLYTMHQNNVNWFFDDSELIFQGCFYFVSHNRISGFRVCVQAAHNLRNSITFVQFEQELFLFSSLKNCFALTCRCVWSISAWPNCSIIRLHTVDYKNTRKLWKREKIIKLHKLLYTQSIIYQVIAHRTKIMK